MKQLLKIALLAGAAIAAVLYGINAHQSAVKSLDYELGKERLRASFVERASFARSLEDRERWADELHSLTRWYAGEWTDLLNRHPERRDENDVLASMEAQVKSLNMSKNDFENRKEWFDTTSDIYKLITGGHYSPVASGVDSGIRLDVVRIAKARYEGRDRMRLDVAIWGAPRREVAQKSGGETVLRRQLDFALSHLEMEFIDDQQKLIGGGSTGAPVLMVDYPERWIPEFPPLAVLGTYWIDAFPENTDIVDLSIRGDIRSTFGPAIPVSFEWNLPARKAWKLGEGEEFEAEERLMPDEMRDRSAGNR